MRVSIDKNDNRICSRQQHKTKNGIKMTIKFPSIKQYLAGLITTLIVFALFYLLTLLSAS